jgi:hypothetical protein
LPETIFFACTIASSTSRSHVSLVAELSSDLQEVVVTRSYVVSDIVIKTAYFSLAGAALVFISMILLIS